MSEALALDIWSDIACPWCWVGKRRLQKALDEYDGETELRWHAFELNPYASSEAPERVDYAARLADKYGTDRNEAQEMIDRMVTSGIEAGVELRFDRIRPSSTFDAHRLLAWSQQFGSATLLKERLFSAYLNEGRAISDHDVLAELAGEVGLDQKAAAAMLASEDFADQVREDESMATRLGITGVPFFVLAGKLAVSGAQAPELLREAMVKAAMAD